MTAIDPEKLSTCLQVLSDIESLPPEHPDAVAVRRATAGIFKSVKQARRHAKRDAVAAADHAVTAATATGAPGRIDDETQGLPLVSTAVGAIGGHAAALAGLLHVQEPLHRGRRVLPPALPGVRRVQPGQARRPHRPHRPQRAAHRRPRQDRHVHRAAAAPRRRAHDDHHPLPERRRAPLRRHAGQRRLAAPAARRGHRPARPGSGRRARRHGGRARSAGHPDQQRGADGAPLPRLLRRARRGGAHPAAGTRRRHHLRPRQRRPPGRARRTASPSTRRRTPGRRPSSP